MHAVTTEYRMPAHAETGHHRSLCRPHELTRYAEQLILWDLAGCNRSGASRLDSGELRAPYRRGFFALALHDEPLQLRFFFGGEVFQLLHVPRDDVLLQGRGVEQFTAPVCELAELRPLLFAVAALRVEVGLRRLQIRHDLPIAV